ncbi:cytosine-specific methyltransferase [Clostridia bacterium]|nr:cytosine-specific methyltransferase [Clostridia bacterium]
MPTQPTYIDIFAGCGGLSTGLFMAGWHGLFAVEKNVDAFSTLQFNLIDKKKHFSWPDWLPLESHDINELLSQYKNELCELRGKITLVAGGPPCQGFSMAGKRNNNDQRNGLVKSYIKFVELVQPEVLIFENVKGFTVEFKQSTETKKYSDFVVVELEKLGYQVHSEIIDMSEFGVPQSRKRFILVAMKNHSPEKVFEFLENHKETFLEALGLASKTTIEDAIGDLEVAHGTVPSPDTRNFSAGIYGEPKSSYQKLMRKKKDNHSTAVDSHRFVRHTKKVVELHENLLKDAPAGKRIAPSDNCVDGLKRRGVTVLDKLSQAPTVTSIPDEMVHYREPRILTVREHARLQSFPDWFEFKGKYTSGGIRRTQEVPRYTQVGNAVPPLFAEQIGLAMLEVIRDE